MSFRLLHTADWRLGDNFRVFGEAAARRRADQRSALEYLAALAVSRGVDAVLIAGNLFAFYPPDETAREAVADFCDRLAAHDIRVLAVPGDCDYSGIEAAGPGFLHGNLHWFWQLECAKPFVLKKKNRSLVVAGLALPRGGQPELMSLRRRAVGDCHVALLAADDAFSTDELAALDADYLALGGRSAYESIADQGRCLGCWCGTPEGLDYSETGARFALLIELGEDRVEIEKEIVNVGVCLENDLMVTSATTEDELAAHMREQAGANVYARFTLRGLRQAPFDPTALERRLGAQFAQLRLRDRTVPSPEPAAFPAHEQTVRGRAVALLRKRLDQAADQDERLLISQALTYLWRAIAEHSAEPQS